jgi:hypothetical protein
MILLYLSIIVLAVLYLILLRHIMFIIKEQDGKRRHSDH